MDEEKNIVGSTDNSDKNISNLTMDYNKLYDNGVNNQKLNFEKDISNELLFDESPMQPELNNVDSSDDNSKEFKKSMIVIIIIFVVVMAVVFFGFPLLFKYIF